MATLPCIIFGGREVCRQLLNYGPCPRNMLNLFTGFIKTHLGSRNQIIKQSWFMGVTQINYLYDGHWPAFTRIKTISKKTQNLRGELSTLGILCKWCHWFCKSSGFNSWESKKKRCQIYLLFYKKFGSYQFLTAFYNDELLLRRSASKDHLWMHLEDLNQLFSFHIFQLTSIDHTCPGIPRNKREIRFKIRKPPNSTPAMPYDFFPGTEYLPCPVPLKVAL